jgi:hypothetical protein
LTDRSYFLRFHNIPEPERRARGYRKMDKLHTIEHSGCQFTTDVYRSPDFWTIMPIWPIEELLARTDYPPAQAQRIRKLNPYGKEEAATCVAFIPIPKRA